MKKNILLILVGLMVMAFQPVQAQPAALSHAAQMSLLTASPGQELYSVFGHSALRVVDPVTGKDEVYNYGTFDFDTPFFYYKFARGQLLYKLAVTTYDRFIWEYQHEGRAMYEQTLYLPREQMLEIYAFLQTNRLPENRYYAYDFFYDNCSTRLRDLIEEFVNPDWGHDPYPDREVTFRDMLKPYVNRLPWSRFGTDLALGLPADKVVSPWHAMFLPDEMFIAFSQARHPDGSALVEQVDVVLEETIGSVSESRFTPVLIGWMIFLVGLATMWRRRWSLWFDRFLFVSLGVMGLVIFFLWFISEHHATNNNMNILWALPTHLYFILKTGLGKTTGFPRIYFRMIAVINFVLLALWLWIPQGFHPAFFPLILLAGFKAFTYGFNFRSLKRKESF
ncbi:MAG: DUF4105 domain-containing protein [Bacteroidales bacterium]